LRYAKGVLITLAAKGLAIPIGIASSIITARYLGPEGRGILAVLIVLQGGVALFGSLGLHASSTYFIARDKKDAAVITSNILTSAVGLGLFAALLLYIIGEIQPQIIIGDVDIVYLNIFLIAIPFTFIAQLLQGVFLAHQKMYEFNLLELLPRALQLLFFVVVLMLLGLGTYEAVLCFVAATVIGGCVYLHRVWETVQFGFRFDQSLVKKMVQYGIKNYAVSIFLFLVMRMNLMLINYKLGISDTGVYSIAMQIVDVVYLVPSTIALLLFPRVAENAEDSGALTAKVLRFSVAAMAVFCVSILLLGGPFIEVFFGPLFSGAAMPLYWLTPGLFSLSLSTIILNDLAGRGLPSIVLGASALALLVNLAIAVPGLDEYGIVGPAIASSVAYIVLLTILLMYFMKRMNIRASELLVLKVSDITSITFRG